MKITFLGTGTSTGIPELNCSCPVCSSTDPRDKRLRSSVLLEKEGFHLLIDCGHDIRQQLLRLGSPRIDAVVITHEHADHTSGLDELRPYCRTERLSVHVENSFAESLRNRYPYCFRQKINPLLPNLELNEYRQTPFQVGPILITPIRLYHGQLPISGFRIDDFAYLTDFITIEEAEYKKLMGLELAVMGALRHEPHPSHQTLQEALRQVERIQPRRTLFTHIAHSMGFHAEENEALPLGVELAYDGLIVEV